MCGIYKVLKIIWCTLSWRCCKKVCDVVAKAAVVSMLLDCHQLDTIVSQFDNSRQDLVGKFPVLGNSAMNWTHAYMCFVDFDWFDLGRDAWMLEDILLLWIVKDTVKKLAIAILANIMGPCRVLVCFEIVRLGNLDLVPVHVWDERGSIFFGF